MGIVKIREKFQVTIPEDVRAKVPCHVGEYVDVEVENSKIVIHPMVLEEKYSEVEVNALEKMFKDPQNRGKVMSAKEFKKYQETL